MKFFFIAVLVVMGIFVDTVGSVSYALGLRSFVALPVGDGDLIMRFQNIYNFDDDVNTNPVSFAYGVTKDAALFVTVPYVSKLPDSDPPSRITNIPALLRLIAVQKDTDYTTFRVGLLGGGLIPVDSDSDGGGRFGAVSTLYFGRSEIDLDGLYTVGFGRNLNTAQYDLSWQYRIFPKVFDEWELGYSINTVLEANGRWRETNTVVHQVTAGLQFVYPRWVFEGGVTQDYNAEYKTALTLSIRVHV